MESSSSKITVSNCYEIVTKVLQEDFSLISHRQLSFDKINGYLGDHSTLEIEIERNGKREVLKFFVKSLPHLESQKTFLLEFNGFFKEKQFFTKYQSLLRQHEINILNDVIPICYYVNEELFVFEDLTSKGFVTLPSREPLSVDCIKLALITMAKLHASGLILEELRGARLIHDYEEELKESFYLDTDSSRRALRACKTGVRAVIDLTHTEKMKISKELFTEKSVEAIDLMRFFTTPSTKFRNTICHADLWTKNFMFKFEEGKAIKCVLVDFQTYRYGPPAQDVLIFIYLVSDKETRRKYFDEFLKFYYEQLRENFRKFNVEDVVTEKEFWESCDYYKRFALTQNLLHYQVVIMSDEIASELFKEPENAKHVLFEDKYEFFKDVWKQDPVFKKMNSEVIEELREFYEQQLII